MIRKKPKEENTSIVKTITKMLELSCLQLPIVEQEKVLLGLGFMAARAAF